MFSWRYVESKILPWCREHGVGILAHSTLGKGLLTGRYKAGHEWSPDDERSNMVDFHGAFWGLAVQFSLSSLHPDTPVCSVFACRDQAASLADLWAT